MSFASTIKATVGHREAVCRFAEALAETGNVRAACDRIGMSTNTGTKYLGQMRRALGAQAV